MRVDKKMFIELLEKMIEHIKSDEVSLENLSSSKSTKCESSAMFDKQIVVHTQTISIDLKSKEEKDYIDEWWIK